MHSLQQFKNNHLYIIISFLPLSRIYIIYALYTCRNIQSDRRNFGFFQKQNLTVQMWLWLQNCKPRRFCRNLSRQWRKRWPMKSQTSVFYIKTQSWSKVCCDLDIHDSKPSQTIAKPGLWGRRFKSRRKMWYILSCQKHLTQSPFFDWILRGKAPKNPKFTFWEKNIFITCFILTLLI